MSYRNRFDDDCDCFQMNDYYDDYNDGRDSWGFSECEGAFFQQSRCFYPREIRSNDNRFDRFDRDDCHEDDRRRPDKNNCRCQERRHNCCRCRCNCEKQNKPKPEKHCGCRCCIRIRFC